MRFYLASTSPARLQTLRNAGVEPIAIAPGVDEDAVVAAEAPANAHDMVALLARAKAEAVVNAHGADIDGFVFGGDSAFVLDGEIYGKPHHPEVARERWLKQRGRSGQLFSGHWLIDHRGGTAGAATGLVSVATVHFADVSDTEIDAYIATGEPLHVAGAFTIDSLGGAFVREIEGDPHTVVGISVPGLRTMAQELGVEWTAFWNR